MGRLSKADKSFKEKTGMTPVELVRHIRTQMSREGYFKKFREKQSS